MTLIIQEKSELNVIVTFSRKFYRERIEGLHTQWANVIHQGTITRFWGLEDAKAFDTTKVCGPPKLNQCNKIFYLRS